MADGDSGIEGEVGTYSEDANAAEVIKENGEEDHVEETIENHTETVAEETQEPEAQPNPEEDDRPVVELFVKVTHLFSSKYADDLSVKHGGSDLHTVFNILPGKLGQLNQLH